MKTTRYLAMVLSAAAIAACNKSDVFYSTSYPIVEVKAAITADKITVPPASEDEEPTTEDNPVVQVIEDDLLAQAPMRAGGQYTLDFTQYNGGPLSVNTSGEAETATGLFVKTPGADSLQFIYGLQDYTCKVSSYRDSLGVSKVALTVDFTKFYQQLYPNDNIKQVLRIEYTSVNRK